MKDDILSPRPPPKISLKHDLNWTKGNDQGSTVENIGQLENSFNSHLEKHFKLDLPSQPNSPKPIEDRTVKPVTQEIVGKSQGELSSSDRAGQPTIERKKNAS